MEFWKIFLGALFLLAAYCYQAIQRLSKNLPVPNYDGKEYWGKGNVAAYKEDESIRPFKISFGDEVISKIKSKLHDAGPFTDPLEGVAFEYGFNSKRLQEVLDYWKKSYLPKWNERQEFLNQFGQFKTQIQGLDIHFIHVKPKVNKDTKVFPLLLMHGWPGSVREFYEIIPFLTTPSKDNIAFEVIAPSLPGFGFSAGAAKKGLGPDKIAVVMRNLMLRVGLEKFYIQAGDWGGIIGAHLSAFYPENVLGYHTNFITLRTPWSIIKTTIASFYPSFFLEEEEQKYVSWMFPFTPSFMFLLQESGYFHLQATKPDTLGIALNGNPVGIAAWILEKFSTATNPDYRQLQNGGFEKDFSLEALIDNVMIYYLSNSATTSARIYKEAMSKEYPIDHVAVIVPTGCSRFKYEISHTFKFILKERFKNIVHSTFYEHGGHFAALPLPKLLRDDFIKFVKKTL